MLCKGLCAGFCVPSIVAAASDCANPGAPLGGNSPVGRGTFVCQTPSGHAIYCYSRCQYLGAVPSDVPLDHPGSTSNTAGRVREAPMGGRLAPVAILATTADCRTGQTARGEGKSLPCGGRWDEETHLAIAELGQETQIVRTRHGPAVSTDWSSRSDGAGRRAVGRGVVAQ